MLGFYVRRPHQELIDKLTQGAGLSYTSFTGCSILLFSASQDLLKLSGEEASQELSYATSHLTILSLCSYDNTIARELYIQLQILFNDIRETVASPVFRTMREKHAVVKDVAPVPLSNYDAVEGAEEVRKTIVDIARSSMNVLHQSLSL